MRSVLLGHVIYVTPPVESPDPLGFLLDTLADPLAILLVAGGMAAALAMLVVWMRWSTRWMPWERLVERAWSYRDLVPWMLRLSFGLVLIGSGLMGTLFVTDAQIGGWPYLIQTAVGFLLLLGLAVRVAALVGLAVYLVSLAVNPALVVVFDLAGGLVAIALLGPGRPSLDDLLRAAFPSGLGGETATGSVSDDRYHDLVPLLVRLGLGGALLASGVADKLLVYNQALATVERYGLTGVIPVSPELWVVGAGLVEASLGGAILLGVATRLSAMATFTVLTLTLFALPDDPAIAHVGLFGLCSILVVLGAGRWSADEVVGKRRARSTRSTPASATTG